MKPLTLLLISISLLLLFSCQSHEHTHEGPDLANVKAELQAMEDAFAKAYNAKDAEAIMAYYADDAISLPLDKPIQSGSEAIMANLKSDLEADTLGGNMAFEAVDVFAFGDYAVEVGRSIYTLPSGEKNYGKYMSLFEKRDGKYVSIRDIFNNDAKVNQ